MECGSEMTVDVEKVIKGLGCHVADPDGHLGCDDCPYSAKATGDNSINNSCGCLNRLHLDASELLKAYSKKPENANRCVCCGEIIPEGIQVCPQCAK